MIRWAALLLLTVSWLFAFGHYAPAEPLVQWSLIGAAWLCATVGLTRYTGRLRLPLIYLTLILPISVAVALAPPPFRPALALLGVGILVLGVISPLKSGWLEPLGIGALVCGTLLVLQSPVWWMVTAFTAKSPVAAINPGAAAAAPWIVDIFGRTVAWLVGWLGSDVSYSGGTVFVRTMRHVHEFPLTWGHMGLLTIAQLWIAAAAIIWLDRGRRGIWTRLIALSWGLFGFSILRVVVLMTLFVCAMAFVEHESDTVHVEVFWLPSIAAVSWLFFTPFLARIVDWPRSGMGPALRVRRAGARMRRLAIGLLAPLGVAAIIVGVTFFDPGTRNGGRILLDESHSQWERTDHEFDTVWYGHESVYNYYCMAQYLDHYYDLDFNMDGRLTPEMLATYDVLILKTPTDRYDAEEIDAIEAFVNNGGGLFALGEHTNVFGSSVCLNPVVKRFGIQFRPDSVFDIDRKWEQVHFPGGLHPRPDIQRAAARAGRRLQRLVGVDPAPPAAESTRIGRDIRRPEWWRRLGVHPIMQDVPFDRFAVSCSIASDWDVRSVIRSHGLWDLPADYTAGNFYPHVEDTTYARFGSMDQMVSVESGAGRVVAFGDSTVYSNFLAFYPGKAEKLLGTIEWLNRSNARLWINKWCVVVGCLMLFIAFLIGLTVRPHVPFAATVVAFSAAAGWVALWATTACSRSAYATPEPHTPPRMVVFALEHAQGHPPTVELPLFGFTQNYANSYEIFYQWVLRLGYFTDVAFTLEDALARTDAVVLAKPQVPFSPAEIDAVETYLKSGGALLVLDGPSNANSTANALLERFGASFGPPIRGGTLVEPSSSAQICTLFAARTVEGGEPLLHTAGGAVLAAHVRVGAGELIVAGLADRFSDSRMGGSPRAVPNREMRAVFETEYALIRGLVDGDIAGEMVKLGEYYRPQGSAVPVSPVEGTPTAGLLDKRFGRPLVSSQ